MARLWRTAAEIDNAYAASLRAKASRRAISARKRELHAGTEKSPSSKGGRGGLFSGRKIHASRTLQFVVAMPCCNNELLSKSFHRQSGR